MEGEEESFLFFVFEGGFREFFVLASGDKFLELGKGLCDFCDEGVVDGKSAKACPEEGIGSCCIDVEGSIFVFFDGEGDFGPERFSDPIFLHGADFTGPFVEGIESLKEVFCHEGDSQRPLREESSFDGSI